MNSCRLAPAWLPHEPPNGPDSPVRADWERCPAGMPASLGLRPALIAATIGASLVGSSLLGTENGFGSLWLASNASLHLLVAAWLLIRPGGATAGMLSAGALSAFVLVVYGSWAPALAAGEPLLASRARRGREERDGVHDCGRPGCHRRSRPKPRASTPLPGVQASESITVQWCCRAGGGGGCFSWRPSGCASSSPTTSALTSRWSALHCSGPSRQTSPKAQPQATTSFSDAGIDVSIGAAIHRLGPLLAEGLSSPGARSHCGESLPLHDNRICVPDRGHDDQAGGD